MGKEWDGRVTLYFSKEERGEIVEEMTKTGLSHTEVVWSRIRIGRLLSSIAYEMGTIQGQVGALTERIVNPSSQVRREELLIELSYVRNLLEVMNEELGKTHRNEKAQERVNSLPASVNSNPTLREIIYVSYLIEILNEEAGKSHRNQIARDKLNQVTMQML
ncbi:hypothetical protein [Anthocerotibacter panamensis]|uniref:hypothetical protein n=1 Tax=Anthocerotibacter panamensis TaxID=2857077 RepID=UPI001C40896A|nr:hypothetical protein [Anthocerotibacter panamensis]